MKIITIKLSKRAYTELRTHVNIKYTNKKAHGIIDALAIKIINAVEDGKSEVTLQWIEGENDSVPNKISDLS